MRCPQCGSNMDGQAAFCSRCGARLFAPRPAAVSEFALAKIFPSWWRFAGSFVLAAGLLVLSAWLAVNHQQRAAVAALAVSFFVAVLIVIARRSMSWSLTSERLIEYRGLLFSRRREVELADIRSVEVNRGLTQRMAGIGNVLVASAASTDFLIRLEGVARPDEIAEMLRQARLKRLA
jgi:membrane protein YdbS with pleckstrin-like domain